MPEVEAVDVVEPGVLLDYIIRECNTCGSRVIHLVMPPKNGLSYLALKSPFVPNWCSGCHNYVKCEDWTWSVETRTGWTDEERREMQATRHWAFVRKTVRKIALCNSGGKIDEETFAAAWEEIKEAICKKLNS